MERLFNMHEIFDLYDISINECQHFKKNLSSSDTTIILLFLTFEFSQCLLRKVINEIKVNERLIKNIYVRLFIK
jgi:hypothetical protein